MFRARLSSMSTRFLLMAFALPGAQAEGQETQVRDTIPGTDVSFAMTLLPAGTFVMGSPETEAFRDDDEGPQHRVRLDAFWIGVYEVTHDEFAVFRDPRRDSGERAWAGERSDVDAITRPTPPYEDPSHGRSGTGRPATGMTQWAALQYARWLSLKTGRLYRLPTEAEWEYACRAGTDGAGPFAPGRLDEHAWFGDNSEDTMHPVGTRSANGWGLHDMLGNAAEWTMDQYVADAYAVSAEPVAAPWARPTRDYPHVVRGGAYDDGPPALRCADRLPSTSRWKRRDPQLPKSRWWHTDAPHVGFRLVRPDRQPTLPEIRAYWDDVLGERGS